MLIPSTANFKLSEFIKTTHLDLQDENAESFSDSSELVDANLFALMCVLEYIRDLYGSAIKINSGYRCPALNSRVGGAAHSAHLYGRAADIRPVCPNDSPLFEKQMRVLRLACEKAKSLGMLAYIKYYPTYLHVNIP